MLRFGLMALMMAVGLGASQVNAQVRPESLPSGLPLTYAMQDGLSQQNGVWTGVVRNGNAADNDLDGTNADDFFYGAAGTDTLTGYAGFDLYVFQPGDGEDVINDIHPEGNKLVFRGGILAGDLEVSEESNSDGFRDRLIRYGDGDVIRIVNWTGLPDATRSAWSMEFVTEPKTGETGLGAAPTSDPATTSITASKEAAEDLIAEFRTSDDDLPRVVVPADFAIGFGLAVAALFVLFSSIRRRRA